MQQRRQKPVWQQDIARRRINHLFAAAREMFKEDPKLSDRYVELARKISMKYKVPLPSHLKRQFCKHCYAFLMPGSNARVRIKDKILITMCMRCKKFTKFAGTI